MIDWKKLKKSALYRFYSSIITIIVSFIITGNWYLSTAIGFIDSSIKIITYYGFETFWEKYFQKK